MADLNDFIPVDDVDDVEAHWVADLVAASFRSEYKNVETLSATKTLSNLDTPIQRYDCNGADRIVKMPTADAVDNHPFFIVNATSSGSWILTLQSNDGATDLGELEPEEFAFCIPDGNGEYKFLTMYDPPVVTQRNILLNGSASVFQRPATPTTVVNMTDDVYNAPDCFYSLVQGAGATINQQDGIVGKSRKAIKLVAGGTTNRYGIAQIVESANSIPMRGRDIIAQCVIKPVNNAGSGTRDYRIAILEWTGTVDAVTSELVADWTSGTFTTAGFFASTSKTLVGTASFTITHNTETVIYVTGTVSSNCNNLIYFVWVEDVPTHASDYALLAELGLYPGNEVQVWTPPPMGYEQLACERFGEASGSIISYIPVAGNKSVQSTVAFRTKKFGNPTVVCTSASGTLNKIGEYNSGGTLVTDWAEGLTSIDTNGFFYFATGGGLTAGNTLRFSFKAFVEL